jgi:hypothetical protein
MAFEERHIGGRADAGKDPDATWRVNRFISFLDIAAADPAAVLTLRDSPIAISHPDRTRGPVQDGAIDDVRRRRIEAHAKVALAEHNLAGAGRIADGVNGQTAILNGWGRTTEEAAVPYSWPGYRPMRPTAHLRFVGGPNSGFRDGKPGADGSTPRPSEPCGRRPSGLTAAQQSCRQEMPRGTIRVSRRLVLCSPSFAAGSEKRLVGTDNARDAVTCLARRRRDLILVLGDRFGEAAPIRTMDLKVSPDPYRARAFDPRKMERRHRHSGGAVGRRPRTNRRAVRLADGRPADATGQVDEPGETRSGRGPAGECCLGARSLTALVSAPRSAPPFAVWERGRQIIGERTPASRFRQFAMAEELLDRGVGS